MKVKKEVRELCVKLLNADPNSREFKSLQEALTKKYKFTPFNLLALWTENAIEYNSDNFSLVMEEEGKP